MTVTAEHCAYPWTWAMVSSDGILRPCCYGAPVGSLHQAGFEELWNGRTMLEVRHSIRAGQLHSVCRAAACFYAAAKRAQPGAPGLGHQRYAFSGVTARVEEGVILLAGTVTNAGETAWTVQGRDGAPLLNVGARLFAPDGTTVHEARSLLPHEFVFPGEPIGFQLALPAKAEGSITLDLVYEHEYWFEQRGAEPLRFALPIQRKLGSDGIIRTE